MVPIIFVVLLLLPHMVFAQEYLKVKSASLGNNLDVCSRLVNSHTPDEFYANSPHFSNRLSEDLASNHTRITMIDYNGTKLIVTLTPRIIPNTGLIYDRGTGMPPQIYKSNSSSLQIQHTDTINLKYDQYNKSGFTMAMVNTGNKDVAITYPFASILGIVMNSENGSSVYLDHHGISSGNPFADDKLWSLTWPNTGFTVLKSGQSIIQYYILSRPLDVPPEYYEYLPPGNYTIATVARLLGDVNGTCSMVYLWSQPVQLTILPPEKVPEFPFAIPVFIISIASLIIFYRMKFR